MTDHFKFNAIGFIRSGFKEKFAVPRQPGLVKTLESSIEIVPPFAQADAFRELERFSHIWIIFVFHQCLGEEWHTTVRPPRMGGNARVGVFASRAPFRPNPIGISAVELLGLQCAANKCSLHIRGADLIDGTPVLDIKPYIPYADQPPASSGYATRPESGMHVEFTKLATTQIAERQQQLGQPLMDIVRDMLALDPRPAYRADKATQAEYGVRLFDFNLRFSIEGDRVTVQCLEQITD